ncbi:SDR family NAD(P)-dependent oxidoreductase [Embleya scabrispora]|uniref:SDR family NAD(P)-dependent oxidoreductase n=1 Tax=Embleya scabrispora TaxID=159449 RepID=UPI002AA2B419|nr:SDR family NAD(P)-dependent oxidoreductase [Embleya scabrispora]
MPGVPRLHRRRPRRRPPVTGHRTPNSTRPKDWGRGSSGREGSGKRDAGTCGTGRSGHRGGRWDRLRHRTRDAAAVRALADAALAGFGRIDVVCNNAGVWTLNRQWETELADWRWVVDVNLWGVVHGVRTFVPLMLAQPEGGHIVNTASMGGLIGGAMTGPYGATKHAIVGLTKGLRAELAGTAVGVSLLCPGKVRSEMLDRVDGRPATDADDEAPDDGRATPSARDVLDAMRRSQAGAMSAAEAGEQVAAAIREDRFWVLPGADAHVPLVRAEFDELIGAFESMSADG